MTDKLSTDPYKGVRDFYPEDMALQQYIFAVWARVAESYGFVRYDASILEPAELYRAKTSEEIVNEQTYTFTDRGDREVTLRPEMTPTVARMVAGKRRELTFPVRWYSMPNLFRYERPQRGRVREHWQLNCDIFGTDSVYADIEIVRVAYDIMRAFGAEEKDFEIRINNRALMREWYEGNFGLDDERIKTLTRIVDRRNKITQEAFEDAARGILGDEHMSQFLAGINAKSIDDFWRYGDVAGTVSSKRFTELAQRLRELGVANVVFDPALARGFDYYTGFVFEVFDTDPENKRSLFGGGRYDNLTELFGGERIPGVGFGMGDVTIRDFLETHGCLPDISLGPDVMLLTTSTDLIGHAEQVASDLRSYGLSVIVNLTDKKLGDQLAQASKRNARTVITVGEDEVMSGTFTLRNLADGNEIQGSIIELESHIKSIKN